MGRNLLALNVMWKYMEQVSEFTDIGCKDRRIYTISGKVKAPSAMNSFSKLAHLRHIRSNLAPKFGYCYGTQNPTYTPLRWVT